MMRITKESKIFITGHRGMVGAALTNKLNENGYENLLFKTSSELDLTHQEQVRNFIKEEKPDFVIHAAAKVGGIQANINNPTGFLTQNILMNFNLLNSCIENEIQDVLFFGSSCMYPKDYKNPLKEEYLLEAPLEPTNEGYALSKICGAKCCEYVNKQYGWNYKTIIPCNLFGVKDHFESERSHLLAAIIAKISSAIAQGEKTVEIWGDGTARREFLYVEDLADFIAVNLNQTEQWPDLLNVGLGKDYSVKEYYKMVADILGYKGEFEYDLSKPTGMKYKLMDSSKAFDLGWNPQHTIEEGLIKTCKYYQDEIHKRN